MDIKEAQLEQELSCVLHHNTIASVLNGYEVSGRSIGAAIKAYCKTEHVGLPDNFTDAEVFVTNVHDFWEETKPGFHERLTFETVREGIRRYLAFKHIWKEKVSNNNTEIPQLQVQASTTLTLKSALAAAVIAGHSHTKNDPRLRPGELAEAMEITFQALLPVIHKIQKSGELEDDKVKFLAKKIQHIIESEEFELIEYKNQEEAEENENIHA